MVPDEVPPDEVALDAWRRRTLVPMLAAASAFLGVYAWPIIDPGISARWQAACDIAMVVIWLLFGADYLVRLYLAPRRWEFAKRNWFDLLILLAPMLRSLRLVQTIMVLSLLNKRARMTLRASVARYAGAAAVLIVFCAALAVLDAERGAPGSVIGTFHDALWWSATTVTTVGYGDLYPVTAEGRLVAGVLFPAGSPCSVW